jgi:cell division protein FtsB
MRVNTPLLLLICALVTAVISLLADGGYSRLVSMERGVARQARKNEILQDQVQSLKREVIMLQNDPRAVEKAARSELGMSRPDEVTVIFEKKSDLDTQKEHGARE